MAAGNLVLAAETLELGDIAALDFKILGLGLTDPFYYFSFLFFCLFLDFDFKDFLL